MAETTLKIETEQFRYEYQSDGSCKITNKNTTSGCKRLADGHIEYMYYCPYIPDLTIKDIETPVKFETRYGTR
jgi:hypothetical protein